MILPAIPHIIVDLDISYAGSSWILVALLVTAAVMTPIAGKLSDIFGKKKILLIIFAVYILGLVIGATPVSHWCCFVKWSILLDLRTKWVCPKCGELSPTRHWSVGRHIMRKHAGIGEPGLR